MKSFHTLALFLFTTLTIAQELRVISSDNLIGEYVAFAHNGADKYYALSAHKVCYTFDLNGNILDTTELDCGFVCNFYDIEIGPDGKKYFATRSGVFVENADGTLEHLFGNAIIRIAFGQDGEIYFAGDFSSNTQIGVYKDGEMTSYNSENSIIERDDFYDLKMDSKGSAWIGGADGLYKFANGELSLEFDEQVGHIHIDANDKIYISKTNGGLRIFEPNSSLVDAVNWQNAQGGFFAGHSDGQMYAAEFGKLYYNSGTDWTTVDLESLGVPSLSPNAGFMDTNGNFFLSIDFYDEIYVFSNELSSLSQASISMTVSPNPTHEKLEVTSPNIIDKLSIVNILGQEVMTKNVNDYEASLNVHALNPGNYFIIIRSENLKSIEMITIK